MYETTTLDFALQTKAIAESGEIEGLAAGYGNEDYGGDIIVPGALTKSLAGRATVPMLLFHDQKRPVGVWNSFKETDPGLVVGGRLVMSTVAGKEAHALVSGGAIGGLSIGYTALKHQMVGKARELREITIHEVSLVTIPMNERAVVTSVKTYETITELWDEFEEKLHKLDEADDETVKKALKEIEVSLKELRCPKSMRTYLADRFVGGRSESGRPPNRGEPEGSKAIRAVDVAEAFARKFG